MKARLAVLLVLDALFIQPSAQAGLDVPAVQSDRFAEIHERLARAAAADSGVTTDSVPPAERVVEGSISGAPRDFSPEDAEMQITAPMIAVNGIKRIRISAATAIGQLVWFYVPGYGRYILSLAPRRSLGFAAGGEVRGGSIKVTVDGNEFSLDSPFLIAPGLSPFTLYVLHELEWQPTVISQRDRVLFGSVSPQEIEALSRR